MNKITPKSIQMFVAGTLAYMGFGSLVWIPYYLVVSKDSMMIFGSVVAGFGLLVGIAMLLGNSRAFLWAQIYLWIGIVCAICTMFCLQFHLIPIKVTPTRWWRVTFDLLEPTIQLSLLLWSRSKHFLR